MSWSKHSHTRSKLMSVKFANSSEKIINYTEFQHLFAKRNLLQVFTNCKFILKQAIHRYLSKQGANIRIYKLAWVIITPRYKEGPLTVPKIVRYGELPSGNPTLKE